MNVRSRPWEFRFPYWKSCLKKRRESFNKLQIEDIQSKLFLILKIEKRDITINITCEILL